MPEKTTEQLASEPKVSGAQVLETRAADEMHAAGAQGEGSNERQPASKPASKKRRKWPITLGVVAAVVVVVSAGLMVWHEQPSFCAAICHDPMDPYLETYAAEPGQTVLDKFGNEVPDASYLLSVEHKQLNDTTCLDCHVPTMEEQISEGLMWISGNYESPLSERTLADLTEARGVDAQQFCSNDTCHKADTPSVLARITQDLKRNPHALDLPAECGEYDCATCHKAHRQSVMVCADCHDDAVVPEGWVVE